MTRRAIGGADDTEKWPARCLACPPPPRSPPSRSPPAGAGRVPPRLHDRQPRRPRPVRDVEGTVTVTPTAPELRRAYRDTIGHFASGVTIVTTNGPDGPAGMTTNAVTSLSLDPLLLLVCFERRARTLAALRVSERFAINILRADDRELARVFASKRVAREKFESVTHV